MIDHYKAQKAVEKEASEGRKQAEMLEKYKTDISRQMVETQIKKRDGKVEVQKDRDEIELKMALYRKDQALEK